MKRIKNIFVTTLFIPLNLFANSNTELTNYFKDQINSLNQSVIETETMTSTANSSSEEMWYFDQFMLRFKAPIGFKIDGLASFLIVPETEFLWQRSSPQGWTNYKPPTN